MVGVDAELTKLADGHEAAGEEADRNEKPRVRKAAMSVQERNVRPTERRWQEQ